MLCISDLIMNSSTISPVIIPVSSILQVLGRNYDESILLTSKYNQSLLRDRRRRIPHIIDSQTGIHQMNSSFYYKTSDRINVTRPDQICAYPRRTFRRQSRHNPYMITINNEQKNPKIDLNDNTEVLNSSEQKTIEICPPEIKSEPIINVNEDQVVIIPNEFLSSNKIIKRRIISNITCQYCKQKFKNKNQLNSHLINCQYESEQNEQINRRHYSKSESLLVSLLKQEAITEKQDNHSSKIASILMSQPIVSIQRNEAISFDDSDKIQIKLEKKDEDFIIKKQKITKKTTNKNQSIPSIQSQSKSLLFITCTMCGEGNMINDELIRCSTCEKSMHAYKCLNFENNNIVQKIKTYSWQCVDCKKCIQCGTVEHDDELLFCDHCDRAYHMDCLKPPLSEPPPGAWYCQLCI